MESTAELRARLGNGRQYGYSLEQIKKNHVERYRWAKQFCEGQTVVDCGCGIGYGSSILAERAKEVIGIESNEDVAGFATEHWAGENVRFEKHDLMARRPPRADVYVAFECIEHFPVPGRFLGTLPKGSVLVGSVPDEQEKPFLKSGNPHHFRHYTSSQLVILLQYWKYSDIEVLRQGTGPVGTGKGTLVFSARRLDDDCIAPSPTVAIERMGQILIEKNEEIVELRRRLKSHVEKGR